MQTNDEISGLVFFYLFIIGLEALRRQPVSANESGFIATIKRMESLIVSAFGISYLPYLLHNSIVGVYSFLGSIPWFYVLQATRSLAIAWTTFIILRNVEQMPAYEQEEEDHQDDGKKEEASNGELKPSWDSNANHAWSCDNWEQLAMEAAYKERAQSRGKSQSRTSKRQIKTQNKEFYDSDIYVVVRTLSDLAETLEKKVDYLEKQREETKKKAMETEVCDDPTLEGDEDENEDGELEARSFQCRAGNWCRRNCCMQKKRKWSWLFDGDDQHEVEDWDYVKVTTGVDY